MICPKCNSENTMVIDTRQFQAYRRRRYKCLMCNERFTTKETISVEEPKKEDDDDTTTT